MARRTASEHPLGYRHLTVDGSEVRPPCKHEWPEGNVAAQLGFELDVLVISERVTRALGHLERRVEPPVRLDRLIAQIERDSLRERAEPLGLRGAVLVEQPEPDRLDARRARLAHRRRRLDRRV